MADKSSQGDLKPEAQFAKRIYPAKDQLTREQMQFIRQVELEQWKKKAGRLRGRNVATALGIGAVVLGICILYYSVMSDSTQGYVSARLSQCVTSTR